MLAAGCHYDCIFVFSEIHATMAFQVLTVFGSVYFAMKFPIISFVVIRNIIVSWICSWQVKHY